MVINMTCVARQHNDQMICHRCQLQWDVNDPEPPACEVACQPTEIITKRQRQTAESIGKIIVAKAFIERGHENPVPLNEIEEKTVKNILDWFQ